jgi:Sugar-transfer associated ATP-grasp
MHQYLYWIDLPALGALNARRGANGNDVQDKHRFATICASFGLPHVETLAAFERGQQIVPDAPFMPDRSLLFVKGLRASQSQGAERWTREGNLYRDTKGSVVPADRLHEVLRRHDCIVQHCLANHDALAPRTNGALATLRLVTGIGGAGAAELVYAMLVLPRGPFTTTTGGIICALTPDTGTIRRAFDLSTGTEVPVHPDTNAPLLGFKLPFHGESIALVQRAHALAFSRFAFLGWDVAITDDGAVLLETNSGWGALHHQILDGPIGHTVFGRLVAEHVA